MKKLFTACIAGALALACGPVTVECVLAREVPTPPDLTQEGVIETIDRELTYNLGPTGLRGWIYTKAAGFLDGAQGRTTAAARAVGGIGGGASHG